jgi:MoxR-like ATPase
MFSPQLKEYIEKIYEIKDFTEDNFYKGSFQDFEVRDTSQGNFRFNSALLFPLLTPFVNGGSVILAGGIGGGKTSYLKCLGAMITNQELFPIEESILRCHSQLTEEQVIGRYNYADMLGSALNLNFSLSDLANMSPEQLENIKKNFIPVAEALSKVIGPRETVEWRKFVNPSQPWKIADEINLLSPWQQNMFLPIFGEGIAKYSDYVIKIKNYRMLLTMNWPEPGTFEWRRAFSDRIALCAPAFQASAADLYPILREGPNERLKRKEIEKIIAKAPKLGKMGINQELGISYNTAFWELPSRIDEEIKMDETAEIYIVSLARELSLCIHCTGNDKGQAVDKKPTDLCDFMGGGCHYKTKDYSICYKTKGGLSTRAVKEHLYTFSKALAAFLGMETVEKELVHALAPYVLLHRVDLSKDYEASDKCNMRLEYIKENICETFNRRINDMKRMYEVWDKAKKSGDNRNIMEAIRNLKDQTSSHLIALDYEMDLEKELYRRERKVRI